MQKVIKPTFYVPRFLSQKERILWRRFLRYQARGEMAVKAAVKRYAKGLSRRLKNIIASLYGRRSLADLAFPIDAETERLFAEIEPVLTEILEDAPSYFGVEVDETLYEPRVKAALRTFRNRMRWISETTYERLKKKLGEVLAAGGGWKEMIDAVESVVGELETWRAERIARTEATGASNLAFHEILRIEGFRYKQWLSAEDERVRQTHQEAHGQVVEIHQPFIVGGYRIMYPAEPTAPPHEVINCRCTVVPYAD